MSTLVEVRSLEKHFRVPTGWFTTPRYVRAVDGVDLDILPGETFGLVGESGCGKTTLGRLILRLAEPTAGRILFDQQDITILDRNQLRPMRREAQIVFQNPLSSLSPRLKVEQIVAEPLVTHHIVPRADLRARVVELLKQVGLSAQHLDRF